MKLVRWALVGLASLVVAACGGGGGGASGTSPPTSSDPNAATFQFSDDPGRVPVRSYGVMLVAAMDSGASLLRYAQFATDLAHRFASADSPATVTANCAYTGSITLRFDDRDGDQKASAGDSVTAVLSNCGVPALAYAATGTLRLEIVSASPSADVSLAAKLVIVDTLRIAAWDTGPYYGPVLPGTLRGSLAVQWNETATGAQLRATSSTEDNWRFTATRDGVDSTDSFRQIDVSQNLRYDLATATGSMAFLFDVGSRGGTLRVRSAQPFQGDLNALPKLLRIDAEIAGKEILRVERGPVAGGVPSLNAMLLNASGQSSLTSSLGWPRSAFLFTKDARATGVTNEISDQGFGSVTLQPWRGAALALEIDFACQQQSSAGITRFRADALFQRPVAYQPALTQGGAVIRLQFGRAIAGGADLQFRLKDTAEVFDAGSPPWDVATTTVRRGAYYEIRPVEPLRQGRSYLMQSSYDGVDWTGSRVIMDAQGNIVSSGGSSVANVSTDRQLVAETTYSDLATVAASSPARLRSDITLRDGQTVSSYQWQQISGVPVVLSTPQDAETDLIVDSTNPRAVGDAVVQLTVTDSLGTSDRVRVVLKVGNFAPQGAVLYTEARLGTLSPRRAMRTGAGSIFYGPESGRVLPRVPSQTEGGTGVAFSVTPANGIRLVVGSYPNAVVSAAPGPQSGLISGLYCNTPGSPVSGSFEVLDVAFAADDTITRLAIDFVQKCDAGYQEFTRGSYRFNSTLALRP